MSPEELAHAMTCPGHLDQAFIAILNPMLAEDPQLHAIAIRGEVAMQVIEARSEG